VPPLIFHIASPIEDPLRPFAERDLLERDGAVVMPVFRFSSAMTVFENVGWYCTLDGFDEVSGADRWENIGQWLLANRRVILYLDWTNRGGWEAKDLVPVLSRGACVIIVKTGELPPDLKDFRSYVVSNTPGSADAGAK
jgi:hypothetical protein